jgi:tRNA G18 (ribose-2'-O)-methylase SpoU
MVVERITSPDDARIEGYRATRDGALARARGTFLAEGRLVVGALLERSDHRARSVVVTEAALAAIEGSVAIAAARWGAAPAVYLVDQPVIDALVGFHIHRGCIAEGERGRVRTAAEIAGAIEGDGVIVVTEGVNNHDNVGGIFRTALALGARAVVIDPGTADPLYRKAIRVSMGAALRVPWGASGELPRGLDVVRSAGFRCVALTPGDGAPEIGAFAAGGGATGRIALVVGAEGPGITPATAAACDARVRIAMAPGVDSLNVATATGIALHRLVRPEGYDCPS